MNHYGKLLLCLVIFVALFATTGCDLRNVRIDVGVDLCAHCHQRHTHGACTYIYCAHCAVWHAPEVHVIVIPVCGSCGLRHHGSCTLVLCELCNRRHGRGLCPTHVQCDQCHQVHLRGRCTFVYCGVCNRTHERGRCTIVVVCEICGRAHSECHCFGSVVHKPFCLKFTLRFKRGWFRARCTCGAE